MTRGSDQSDALRARLASVGIFLEDPKTEVKSVRSIAADVNPDRGAIREILIAAGAPEQDMDWLVNSCPSIDAAMTYRPSSHKAGDPSGGS